MFYRPDKAYSIQAKTRRKVHHFTMISCNIVHNFMTLIDNFMNFMTIISERMWSIKGTFCMYEILLNRKKTWWLWKSNLSLCITIIVFTLIRRIRGCMGKRSVLQCIVWLTVTETCSKPCRMNQVDNCHEKFSQAWRGIWRRSIAVKRRPRSSSPTLALSRFTTYQNTQNSARFSLKKFRTAMQDVCRKNEKFSAYEISEVNGNNEDVL